MNFCAWRQTEHVQTKDEKEKIRTMIVGTDRFWAFKKDLRMKWGREIILREKS